MIVGSIGSVARASHSSVLSIKSRWFRSESKGKIQNSSKNASRNRMRSRKEFWYCVINFSRFSEERTPSRYCNSVLFRDTFFHFFEYLSSFLSGWGRGDYCVHYHSSFNISFFLFFLCSGQINSS